MESLSIPVGYGVELAALIDTASGYGLDSVAQVDLGFDPGPRREVALGAEAHAAEEEQRRVTDRFKARLHVACNLHPAHPASPLGG